MKRDMDHYISCMWVVQTSRKFITCRLAPKSRDMRNVIKKEKDKVLTKLRVMIYNPYHHKKKMKYLQHCVL